MAPIEKSEVQLGRSWDKCITNALIKTGAGVAVGGLFSLLFFKRKAWPVTLLGGMGFGMAVGNCNSQFRNGWRGPPWAGGRPPWAGRGPYQNKEDWEKFKKERKEMWEDLKKGGWTIEEMLKLRQEVWEEVLKRHREKKANATGTQVEQVQTEESPQKTE